MRLVSCYITAFGQVKNFSYEFDKSLETICQENGWGKTTFSVFIKAMFYGMEYTTKTKELPERKHYLPWDGSICGGNLVFEVGDKIYRVERTFGAKDKDDTFQLIDVMTGKESTDYSENLGEELFEVDRASFEKSIFIPQSAISTVMTDSLNAKMGGLASTKDDISNFDKAVKRVAEEKRSYTRKSKTNNGKLSIVEEEIRACKEQIDKKVAILDGYHKQRELLEEKKKRLNWIEAEKNRVGEQILSQSKREQEMGAYRQQLGFLHKQQEELAKMDQFFAKGVPDMEKQDSMEDLERQFDVSSRAKIELADKLPVEQQIQKWQQLFNEGVPTEQEIKDWQEKALYMQELRLQGKHAKLSEDAEKKLEELKYFFSKKIPTEEEITQIESDVVELSKLEGRIVEQDEQFRNLRAESDVFQKNEKEESRLGVEILLFGLSIAFFLGAMAFRLFLPYSEGSVIIQIIFFVGMAGTFVAGWMNRSRKHSAKQNRQEDVEQRLLDATVALDQSRALYDELSRRTKEFLSHFLLTPSESMQQMVYEIRVNLDQYHRLMKEAEEATANTTGTVEEVADLELELYTSLDRFANAYGMDLYHQNSEITLLENLNRDARFFQEYLVNRKQMDLLCLTMDKQQELLEKYIAEFPVEKSLAKGEALKQIRSSIENYGRLQEEVQKLQEDMKQFEDKNQIDEDMQSVEMLQQQQEQIEQDMKEIHKGISQDKEALAALGEELDAIDEAESRLELLQEEKLAYQKKVELLEDTEQYLVMAKEQFLSKYMGPLRKGMDHYLTLLDAKYKGEADGMDFDINMDLAVQVIQNGATHVSDFLSCGYQDLVSLCARFALIDVLYKKEQPMVILDDPLTNLDEEKTARALALLQDVAKERQIIYFTCHESRMPSQS